MADEDDPKPGKKPPVVPPVVRPVVPPAAAPVVPPVVRPVAAPVVPPVGKPAAAPVVAPVVKPAPAPRAEPAAAPTPAPTPASAAAAMERHHRAADRVAGYSGAPVAAMVAAAVALLSCFAALLAWHFSRSTATAALDSVDEYAAAAARLLAAGDAGWWDPRHGTADDMRTRVQEVLAREELELRQKADGPDREALRQRLEFAKATILPVYLADQKGVDDVIEDRNRERLKAVALQDAVVGADLYTEDRRPRRIGAPMPELRLEPRGDLYFGSFLIADRGIRGRACLAPMTGVRPGGDGKPAVVGYAGVAISAEPAWAAVDRTRKSSLQVAGSVLGLGLLAALLAFALLLPLRRVLRDAEEFSRGNFDHRPAPPGGGEVGAIGRAVARTAITARDREMAAQKQAAAATPEAADHRAVVGAALAPGPLLKVPNWETEGTSRACVEIAGDFFDYAPAAGGRFAAIMAETSVRGLPAAFASARIQAHFRALAPSTDSASVLLDSLGAAAGPGLPEDAEIHATVIVVDPATGHVGIARAGKSNPPVVWRAADRSLEKLPVEGPPVRRADGAGTGASAGLQEIELQARDRLSLVSDGLFRARNSRKEKFGEQRLDGLVLKFGPMNSTAFVNMVVNEVDLFHEGAPQRDDLTLLTVRRLK